MFEQLSEKLSSALKKVTGQGRIKESDLEAVLGEVKTNLLDSDVNLRVTKELLDAVRKKALGSEVLGSLSPGQHITKILWEEFTQLLGGEAQPLNIRMAPPVPIMVVGLQGSGKTTFCGKLALHLKKQQKKSAMLVPADIYRPAAKEQLRVLAQTAGAPFFDMGGPANDAVAICSKGLEGARKEFVDCVIYDTAGRLHVDKELMDELVRIKAAVKPAEILLVADSMLGQESVRVADEFHKALGLTGIVLSKLDGDARGGAALSMRAVTGVPVKYISNGEKLQALEIFHPDRLAGRILDLGDVQSLMEKAKEAVDVDQTDSLLKKLKKSDFDLIDFKNQLQQVKKLGSMESVLKMIPGMGGAVRQMKDMEAPEKELKKIEAIIDSMTPDERSNPSLLNGSRRERIARGSGTQVTDINRFMKQFVEMQKLMKRFGKAGMRGMANLFR
jgi:signal recognition particle subunit SRP54